MILNFGVLKQIYSRKLSPETTCTIDARVEELILRILQVPLHFPQKSRTQCLYWRLIFNCLFGWFFHVEKHFLMLIYGY